MKTKKILKGLGLWTRKQDLLDQIFFGLTTAALLLCLIVMISIFQ
tara:strand:+ start:522 stop:656 length:135 start_codon:yes stop_codon:yes gene_type:complete